MVNLVCTLTVAIFAALPALHAESRIMLCFCNGLIFWCHGVFFYPPFAELDGFYDTLWQLFMSHAVAFPNEHRTRVGCVLHFCWRTLTHPSTRLGACAVQTFKGSFKKTTFCCFVSYPLHVAWREVLLIRLSIIDGVTMGKNEHSNKWVWFRHFCRACKMNNYCWCEQICYRTQMLDKVSRCRTMSAY